MEEASISAPSPVLNLRLFFGQRIVLRIVSFLSGLSAIKFGRILGRSAKYEVEDPLRIEDYEESASLAALNKNSPGFRRLHGRSMIKKFEQSVDSNRSYKTHEFLNSRSERIFTQSWLPEPVASMRAIVIILHGLNEHSGRYENFARQLNREGYGVFGMDWTGHGCSDGLHGYVESLDNVVSDTRLFIKMVSTDYPQVPIFLFGHSTGGAVALQAAGMDNLGIRGLVLTSPAILIEVSNKLLSALAPLASALLPRFQLPNGGKDDVVVSRDLKALQEKYGDPLVYTGGIRARTGYEVLSIGSRLRKKLPHVRVPFFVLHGSDDRLTEPRGSRALYDQASSEIKKIKLYQGLLHDLLFEPEKEEVIADILHWLNERRDSIH